MTRSKDVKFSVIVVTWRCSNNFLLLNFFTKTLSIVPDIDGVESLNPPF